MLTFAECQLLCWVPCTHDLSAFSETCLVFSFIDADIGGQRDRLPKVTPSEVEVGIFIQPTYLITKGFPHSIWALLKEQRIQFCVCVFV